ncbi:MAG TPA: hypothetical protein VH419_07990, partial [Nocardioidaceae bacterium]
PTGLFNAAPTTRVAGQLAFPSDHTGVEATLMCETSTAQRQRAATATVTSAATTSSPTTIPTTTAAGSSGPSAETVAAITAAFRDVFDGSVNDVDVKLSALEDADVLRPYFLATYGATKAVASRIRVRIDQIKLADPTHADVTYTLLLDGSAVLDHLPGHAVRIGDRWLVSRRTYCDVSTQGATTIPPVCR